uniref:Uncharacterized protein n=1 Tax=Fibrocapsa japonica TaxID=94617 RepID=A0A7S2USW0_9STRA|mmetsp:Transcript_11681/g.17265  ORF Transcript_11681/g.17265 Transcript_11681/m.17265 type:complete len:196 (+) Transcript_11681:2-589(+)
MVGQTISPPKSSSTGGGSSSSSPERLSRAALNLVQVPNPQQWVQWAEEWYRQLPLPRWAPDDTVPLVLGWVAARVFQVVSVSRVWHLVRRDYEHPALELMVFTHVVGDQWLRVLLGRRQLGQAVGLAVAYASLALFTFLAILLEDVLSGILFLPSLLYIVFIVALNVSSWRLDAEKRANPVKPYPVTYVRQEIMQ